jgi:hypothetical protein
MMAFKDGIGEIIELSTARSLTNVALAMLLAVVKASSDDPL